MEILIKTQEGNFTEFKNNSINEYNKEGMEIIHELPNDLGKGGFYTLNCRKGLNLCLNNTTFYRDYHSKVVLDSPMVTFAFCLSGTTRTIAESRKDPMDVESGYALAYYFRDFVLERQSKGGKSIKGLAVHFRPETLISLAYPLCSENRRGEDFLIKAFKKGRFYSLRPMTQPMIFLLKEIFTSPHKGMVQKLFLESRTLELIACFFEQLFEIEPKNKKTKPLSFADKEKIEFAKDIIVNRIQFPPSLQDLASEVGMSHTRLTRGFKKLYGCTVFEYLRNKRLDYGRRLLEENRLSITEVAFEAGFSGSSHFAASFQKVYGVSPSVYRCAGHFEETFL